VTERFKGSIIRPWRLIFQFIGVAFLLGQGFGIPPFGTSPLLRKLFLPNASCRYVDTAPTSCFYYQFQDGMTSGASTYYVDIIVVLLIIVLMVLLLGRIWCSWLCPFGLVQEGLAYLREKMNIRPFRLKWAHRELLRPVKYVILFLTVLLSIPIGVSGTGLLGCQSTLALPFCQVCPAKGFFTVSEQLLGLEPLGTVLPVLAIISLLLFLVSAFFIKMAFCRICPMGAFMALFSRFSLMYLEKDMEKCTKCRICLRVCPVDHDRVYEDMESVDVAGSDCTLCGRCVEMCPEEGCLSLSFGPKRIVSSRKPGRLGFLGMVHRKEGK